MPPFGGVGEINPLRYCDPERMVGGNEHRRDETMELSPSKFTRFILIITVLVMNIIVNSMQGFGLYSDKIEKEKEVRTTLENMAALLDKNISGEIGKVDLLLREISQNLEAELQQNVQLDETRVNRMLEERNSWVLISAPN